MSRSAIAPVKAPDYVQRNIRLPKLPIMAIDTPRGQVTVDEVPGLLTLDFKRADGPNSIGILVYTLTPNVGMLVQLDADTARQTACNLWEMADAIEGISPATLYRFNTMAFGPPVEINGTAAAADAVEQSTDPKHTGNAFQYDRFEIPRDHVARHGRKWGFVPPAPEHVVRSKPPASRGQYEEHDFVDMKPVQATEVATHTDLAAPDHRKLPVTELTLPYPRDGQNFPSLSFDEAEALVELIQRVWRKCAEQVAAREPEGIGL